VKESNPHVLSVPWHSTPVAGQPSGTFQDSETGVWPQPAGLLEAEGGVG